MDELEARVLECFANVFPGIPRERLPRLNQAASAEWDSVLHVTLLAALGEEFGLEIDFEVAEELRSFALVANYVRNNVGH